MSRSCIILGSALLFTVVGAVSAAPGNTDKPGSDSENIAEILKQVKELQAKLDRMQGDRDLQMRSIKDDLARLREKVEQMDKDATARISGSINPNPLVTGTIRLENRYNSGANVIINGKSYRVMPAEVRLVTDQPVGRFSYEVVTDNGYTIPSVERFLSPTRSFPITINP
jgi:hypothetical protein